MKKTFITLIAMLMLAPFGWAQSSDMMVAALSSDQQLESHRIVTRSTTLFEAPTPKEQLSQLISEGDRFVADGNSIAAFRTYIKANAFAEEYKLQGDAVEVLWKLGGTFWQMSQEKNDPLYANIARALWTQAALELLPDPRCARLVSSDSACKG